MKHTISTSSLSGLTALVVNPYITDFKLYDEWMHPVGLYFLIDILISNGIKVIYYDCLERSNRGVPGKYGTGPIRHHEIQKPDCYKNIRRKYKCYGCSEETFRSFLQSQSNIDYIFVGSMMTYWALGVLKTLHHIKEVFHDTPIYCGGIAVQLIPNFFRESIDGVHFITDPFLNGEKNRVIPGFPAPFTVKEDMAMNTAFSLIPQFSHGPLLLSMGCPMKCAYCASKLLQPRYFRRELETVMGEMRFLVGQRGVHDFSFYDDALLVDSEALFIPFLKAVAAMNYPVRLHTPNGFHLRHVTREIVHLMAQAGFTTLRFGYESGDSKYRSYTGGKADPSLLKEKLQLVQRAGFSDVGVYLMGGLPGSTPLEMAEEMRYVASLGVKVKPVFLSPVPGTELFDQYASDFQGIRTNPLMHNDTFFITQLPAWGEEGVEMIRRLGRELNN